ncbi:MAG: GNAT family N-acetyltransferase [Methylobacterium sp.]|jgi:ribosomal protein S18 acetylase RimI-like enzyme|nr:GNAT family N-acetyltransferase [Methylobacterium sp.]
MSSELYGGLAEVLACEQRIVNCWPAQSTLIFGGFAVRFAHGYSGRANSASAIQPRAHLGEADIAAIEQLYREAGLPPTFRDTPLMSRAMRKRLDARGYVLKDASFGMIADFTDADFHRRADVEIKREPSREWIEGISRFQTPDKRSPEHLEAIVAAIRFPAFFATLRQASRAIGFGCGAVDRGYAEIASVMLDPAARGQGIGHGLVETLLAEAVAAGATRGFLQVESNNRVARALYQKLGYRDLYRYETIWKRD